MKILYKFLKTLHSKKGSPTIEYVMLIAAGALLAGMLMSAVNSEPVKQELRQAVACQFSDIMVDESGNSACIDGSAAQENNQASPSDSSDSPNVDTLQPTGDLSAQAMDDPSPPDENKGFFDSIGDTLSDIKQGVEDFIEDPWEETKEAASNAWEGIKSGAQAAWDWAKEHKEAIAATLTAAAGVVLLFVPGGQGFGAGILIGMAAGGGVSYYQGNDLKTILADASIGGVAGAFGGGVTGGVARGAVRYVGRRAAQLIGNSAGASAGSLADDFLHGRKFNWKNATVAAFMGVGFTVVPHMAAQKPAMGITPKAQQATSQAASQSSKFSYTIGKEEAEQALQGYSRLMKKPNRAYYDNGMLGRKNPLEFVVQQRSIQYMSDKQLIYRFKKKLAPRNPKYGRAEKGTYTLHHWKQREEGPLIEMPQSIHQGKSSRLHPLGNKGGIGKKRPGWDDYRVDYWRARYIEELHRRGHEFPLKLE
ncbi:hypothetical protein JOD24_003424 [Kroppenstedtia sanguinis]|uniref:HNH/ENDO VII family nuclease n=1 Tax=Kroppenstedtia sanguinis TaxID=1380684 RepID=UPI003D225863